MGKCYTFKVTLWAMRGLTTIFLLFFIISCSNHQPEKQSPSTINTDTTLVYTTKPTDTATSSKSNDVITDRFLRLIKFLDSSGYSYDTTRFQKTYAHWHSGKSKVIKIDDYIFYDISFEQTIPYGNMKIYKNYRSNDSDTDWYSIRVRETNNFSKIGNKDEKIIQYFFVQKTPFVFPGGEKEKYFVDGIIEEWKFPNNNSAKQTAEQLGAIQSGLVYGINRSAFVCYIENYMYVFHSRAALFMIIIREKHFFEKFAKDNKATITSVCY